MEDSTEGSPVILSREGSRIRVVDPETGEIFYQKRKETKIYSKKPVFVPRRSLIELHKEDESDAGDVMVVKPGCRKSVVVEVEKTISTQSISCPGTPKSILKKLKAVTDENSNFEYSENNDFEQSRCSVSHRKRHAKLSYELADEVQSLPPTEPAENPDAKAQCAVRKSSSRELRRKRKESAEDMTLKEKRRSGSSRSASRSRSKSRTKENAKSTKGDPTVLLSREIFDNIFKYLSKEDLEMCNKVCPRWKRMTDIYLRSPAVFQGKSAVHGHNYSTRECKKFISRLQKLEEKFQRPVKIYLYGINNTQTKSLIGIHGKDFRSSVTHMESLKLESASIRWPTLQSLLKSFPRLRNLCDMNSDHFSKTSIFSCFPPQQILAREVSRSEYMDFKDQLSDLRKLTIHRRNVTNELIVYLNILAQGTKRLQELSIILGPYDTTSVHAYTKILMGFIREMKILMNKNRKYLKRIKFSWKDENYAGYLQTAVQILENIKLDALQELTLDFDKYAMKGKYASGLCNFLQYHAARSLKIFRISKILLNEQWNDTAKFLNSYYRGLTFDFKLVISDFNGAKSHNETGKLLQLPIFYKNSSEMHLCVEHEGTKSVGAMLDVLHWKRRVKNTRLQSFTVTFEPQPYNNYGNFDSFSIPVICKFFPCLTQLKISDRLADHRQIFNSVFGRKFQKGVTKAFLENRDIQEICIGLPKLKVLKLWVDLTSIDDHGMTGIDKKDLSLVRLDESAYSLQNLGHDPLDSFSSLMDLEELSLRGLGSKVSDISMKYGFEGLSRLKYLELWGNFSVTKEGRRAIKEKFRHLGTEVRLRKCLI